MISIVIITIIIIIITPIISHYSLTSIVMDITIRSTSANIGILIVKY